MRGKPWPTAAPLRGNRVTTPHPFCATACRQYDVCALSRTGVLSRPATTRDVVALVTQAPPNDYCVNRAHVQVARRGAVHRGRAVLSAIETRLRLITELPDQIGRGCPRKFKSFQNSRIIRGCRRRNRTRNRMPPEETDPIKHLDEIDRL